MKKTLFAVLLFFTLASNAQNGKILANIEGLKIAYITKELNLSSEEAQKFWPVYYSFFDELKVARQSFKNDIVAQEEQIVGVRRKYTAEFKKVLGTDERTNKVYVADRNFLALVKKEIQKRQEMRGLKNDNTPLTSP